MRFLARGLVLLAGLSVGACASDRPPQDGSAAVREEVHPFVFDSLDERPVSREALRGKPAVLLFLTTWDLSSQAQVAVLVKMAERDGPKVSYAIVALHERHERELVEAYAHTLKVTFPVALGDSESRAGRGPLGDVHMIPTTVVIDAEGRLVKKHVGFQRADVIRASVEAAKSETIGASGR